ncbi:MAG: hypothetical protein M1819_003281 [Sarea resinae]|nr:MAG: hypothetical protein M1819_003281 [Sarea resinae]
MSSRPLLRISRPCLRCCYATAPTSAPAPPLLLKLRNDMKTAMRAKDTNRLNVLRGLLAETTNAAKTSTPFKTDVQLLALLRKRAAASKAAALEFQAAKRDDLKEKEDAQVAVLEEYAGGVETMGVEDIKKSVAEVMEKVKVEGARMDMGGVLKRLVGPGGSLEGKPVERAEVARIVKEAVASA